MKRTKSTVGISARHWRRIKASRVAAEMHEIIHGKQNPTDLSDDDSSDVIDYTKQTFSKKSTDVDIAASTAMHIPQQEDDLIFPSTNNDLSHFDYLFPHDADTDTSSQPDVDSDIENNVELQWFDCQENYSELSDDKVPENDDTTFQDFTEEDRRFHRSDKFKHHLNLWSLAFGIPHIALTVLQVILRNHTDLVLPRDSRTPRKTSQNVDMVRMPDGAQYCHFGLTKAVEEIAHNYQKRGIRTEHIRLIFNIDGLPIYKSSENSIWLIMCSETILKKVYIVGIHVGARKPKYPNIFLDRFVNEAAELCGSTKIINGHQFEILFHALVCDVSAKSMVLNTAEHSGYNSCSKCTQCGTWKVPQGRKVQGKGRVCFPFEPNQPEVHLRTDEEFANNLCEGYQHGNTSLLRIPGFLGVTRVPLDYMHLILLGVVKPLIRLWLQGPKINRLGRQDIMRITSRLLALSSSTPNEFSRRPGAISQFHTWKATQFRSFLLYTGPAILKGVLKEQLYKNFILLHSAVTILLDSDLVMIPQNVEYADQLLIAFVKTFQHIYGKVHVSHNVHNLLHLAADVRTFEPLDDFSAFRYENHMTVVKRQIRKYGKPVQQISKLSYEIRASDILNEEDENLSPLGNPHCSGPLSNLPADILQQYKSFTGNLFSIECQKEKDNAVCLEDGTVVNVYNIVKCNDGQIFIIGREYTYGRNLYTEPPIHSSVLCIVNYSNASLSELKSWPLSQVHRKMWKMPMANNRTLCFPIV